LFAIAWIVVATACSWEDVKVALLSPVMVVVPETVTDAVVAVEGARVLDGIVVGDPVVGETVGLTVGISVAAVGIAVGCNDGLWLGKSEGLDDVGMIVGKCVVAVGDTDGTSDGLAVVGVKVGTVLGE